MRALVPVVLFAAPAFAVPLQDPDGDAVSPPTSCDFAGGVGAGAAPPPPPPPGGGFFGGGFLSLKFPSHGAVVPTNVQIELNGDVTTLSADPPLYAVRLVDVENGEPVDVVRTGAALRPAVDLQPDTAYALFITPTEANPNVQWESEQVYQYFTSDGPDREAPLSPTPAVVHVFVSPDARTLQECGFFGAPSHVVSVHLAADDARDAAWLEIARILPGGVPSLLSEFPNPGTAIDFTLQGTTDPLALGDEVLFAVTARDLAGNVGPASVVRVSARSFSDGRNVIPSRLAPLMCEMPRAPVARVPAALPVNGRVYVEFPFEHVPLALIADGEEGVPLRAVVEGDTGDVLEPVSPLVPGVEYEIAPLPCDRCVCAGCSLLPAGTVTVEEGDDDDAPAAPVVVDLREDLSPPTAEGACVDDEPALVVFMERGVDDRAGGDELLYDVAARIDGGAKIQLARAVAPVAVDDDTIAIRVPVKGAGRVLGSDLELTIGAMDLAGNRSEAVHVHAPEAAAGCAAATTTRAAPWSALALVGLALLRRRR